MKELLENDSAPEVKAEQAVPAISVGKTLREARESLGLSVADVSGQTKIVVRQIVALEADDYQSLPEMAFVRGFVRSYARIVQLDAQPLLAALPKPTAGPAQLLPASVEVPFPRAHSPQLHNLLWLGGTLLLVLPLVLYAVWHYTSPPKELNSVTETPIALPSEGTQLEPASAVAEAALVAASPVADAVTADASALQEAAASAVPEVQIPAVAAASAVVPPPTAAQTAAPILAKPVALKPQMPQPAQAQTSQVQLQKTAQVPQTPAPTALSQPASPQPLAETAIPPQAAIVQLVFGEESWTEVRDRSDKILTSQLHAGGSELRLGGRGPFSLVIGHANAVQLYYRGKQVNLKPYTNVYSEVARVTLE